MYSKKMAKQIKVIFDFPAWPDGQEFWQHENHPVLLDTNEMLEQRMNYLHENPVRAGFVSSPEQWLYSSAVDYYTLNGQGFVELVLLT